MLKLVVVVVCVQLSSIAAARLHSIVQERPVEKLQESCFIVGSVERILTLSVGGKLLLCHLLAIVCVYICVVTVALLSVNGTV